MLQQKDKSIARWAVFQCIMSLGLGITIYIFRYIDISCLMDHGPIIFGEVGNVS